MVLKDKYKGFFDQLCQMSLMSQIRSELEINLWDLKAAVFAE
jgi:hypothetical protein